MPRQEEDRVSNMPPMPVDETIPALKEALRETGSAVLVAAPGAGKTTRVPLALLNEPWLAGGRKIVLLEPRRLAARSAARFMAASLGEAVGETVGYRVRLDTKVGPRTRVEVVTEGVLTRMLQQDPALEDVGLVIFDEFHERSLQADLGLALCLHSRSLFREDLRLLVMSATLEARPVADLLGGAPVIESRGRVYPVDTRYAPRAADEPLESAVARVVVQALREQPDGDALVFLPGAAEIRRTQARLAEALSGGTTEIAALHGSLPAEEQDRALRPSPPGRRKVVLSTSVAETSLTVEGVRIVVDGGLSRVPRFSPRTGMTRLETVPVSLASADQRRGRAGRVAPGVCYRLWAEEDNRRMAPADRPEIEESDLASLALELAVWGVSRPEELAWLNPPPQAAYRQARELLTAFGALTAEGSVTPHGRCMAELGAHPRLAHMMLRAAPLGLGELACELAALLSGRDLLRGAAASSPDADIRLRLRALRGEAALPGVGERQRRLMREEARMWRQLLSDAAADSGRTASDGPAANAADACGLLLALAYPDRIGQRRESGKYLLSGGRGAYLPDGEPLGREPYLAAAELDDRGTDSRIWLAAPVALADLERELAGLIRTETVVRWDAGTESVQARSRTTLGVLTLRDNPVAKPDPDRIREALLGAVRESGLALLPWTEQARQLQQRMRFLHRLDPSFPDGSDESLLQKLEQWLAPHVEGMRSKADLQRLDLARALEDALTWPQRKELEALAPTHLTVPSGSRLRIDYGDPDHPALSVRLQELFGLPDTPRIAGGKVPLTLRLLSPANRPVQVTKDLAHFWRNTYFDIRKDLKGRYPKHHWPDDPLQAPATRGLKPDRYGGARKG